MGVKRRRFDELGLIPPGTDKPTTGNVFYVHYSKGADGLTSAGHGLKPESPFKTLDYAVGCCTADQGDTIIIMEGSDESVSSTIAVDVAGISIIALGAGQSRGMLTAACTGTDNLMEISANDVYLENIYFKGSATGTAVHFIMVKGYDNLTVKDCIFEQGATNLIAIELNSGSDYATFEGCTFFGAAAGADSGIRFTVPDTAAAGATIFKNPIIKNCLFNYIGSAGCDEGVILVSISSGTCAGILIQDVTILGLVDGERAVQTAGIANSVATGLMSRVHVMSADATDVFVVTNILGYIDVYATQAGAKPYGSTSGAGMAPALTSAA